MVHIWSEKGEVTNNTTEIQRFIKDYYKHLHGNKWENLEEKDKYLEIYNHLRMNQDEIENLKRSLTGSEIDLVTKKLPQWTKA